MYQREPNPIQAGIENLSPAFLAGRVFQSVPKLIERPLYACARSEKVQRGENVRRAHVLFTAAFKRIFQNGKGSRFIHCAPYLITLSARASTLGGIVSPMSYAVRRLITNSNLVDNSTGNSLGFAPFRMRST